MVAEAVFWEAGIWGVDRHIMDDQLMGQEWFPCRKRKDKVVIKITGSFEKGRKLTKSIAQMHRENDRFHTHLIH